MTRTPLLLPTWQTLTIYVPARLIGNGGNGPGGGSGGMIPSTAPPFAMTRWVAQTRENYVSVTPYNHTDTVIRGFQGTHQPAIWMGESGQAIIVPGVGEVVQDFGERGWEFRKEDETSTPSYYRVLMRRGGESVLVEMSASECSFAVSVKGY